MLWLLILEHWQWSFPQATSIAYHIAFCISFSSSVFSLDVLSRMKKFIYFEEKFPIEWSKNTL